ncbi:hypothetical protein M9434_001326 [Picochlorum sp. BPE23]|nr:hypothetical protein M9434_001326 [Picochlorum sp. BPE23]KAI8110050.1 hypothetical protein M9435_001730 [Picochlorum sp. BPE23]
MSMLIYETVKRYSRSVVCIEARRVVVGTALCTRILGIILCSIASYSVENISRCLQLTSLKDFISLLKTEYVRVCGCKHDALGAWCSHGFARAAAHGLFGLVIAASMQAVKCVEKLLAAGADATAVSPSDGKTALHLACACRPSMASAKIIALLVQYGADRDAMDHCGRVPGHSLEQMTASQQQGPVGGAKPAALMTPISVLQEIDGCDYLSDDFRMYRYKVELCPHLDSCLHDSAACPYLHPGEKARRRHPREYTYRAVPCPHFRKGNCKLGDMCPLSHGVFEAWLHPSKYRTQLCTEGKACQRDLCFFAHSLDELRDPSEEGCKCRSADSSPGVCSGTTTPSGYVTRDSTENIKLASLQAAAFEKEQVRRANAVADAVEALKTLAASRKTGIWPQHARKLAENEGLPRFGSDCHSVLSIPESSSSDSLDMSVCEQMFGDFCV